MIIDEKITSRIEWEVIRVLAYYQLFHHPLKASEITRFVNITPLVTKDVDNALSTLLSLNVVFEFDGYFSLEDNSTLVDARLEGEIRAESLLKVANRMSKLIYSFPFVKAVFISGSLSKGVVPEHADIDYFIVTKRNKLWIARTLLVMFKRIFLLGSKKFFCVNYFVDEDHMEIPDKNIFTATEIVTLIPMQGKSCCEAFLGSNHWYKDHFPNALLKKEEIGQMGIIKRCSVSILEPLFFNRLSDKFDKYLMKRTYKRWKTLYNEGYSDKEFELAFRTHRGTSKNHDKNYQKRVLNCVEENMKSALSKIRDQQGHG
tara:strand:- start:67178 stop:68125 length:948 start_codon:yes stop_codon:yes gene_type:complete